MKKIFTLLLLAVLFAGCSSDDDDGTNKKDQELWLNGYITTSSASNSDKEADKIRFLFFDSDKASSFAGQAYNTGIDSYNEYTQLSEDPIYTKLIDEGKLLLSDGSTIIPVLDKTTSSDGKTLEVILPVGKYFVVAFYYERGYRRDYWNKYATTYYTLESRYNPQSLTVVIPGYYNQCGSIPWIKWSDAPVEF